MDGSFFETLTVLSSKHAKPKTSRARLVEKDDGCMDHVDNENLATSHSTKKNNQGCQWTQLIHLFGPQAKSSFSSAANLLGPY